MASYRVEVDREIHKQIRRLPGNVRQRVIRALKGFRNEPRPSGSKPLSVDDLGVVLPQREFEPRRLRIESWRIVYVIEGDDLLVSVLAIRKRPPYQYDDLKGLLESTMG
jgi:mRNA interferase RelE/StbE